MVKVGINGFGRIGRLVFRGMLKRDDLEVVAINNPSGLETAAYLLKYDTVHGRLDEKVEIDGDDLIIEGKRVHVLRVRLSAEGTRTLERLGGDQSHCEVLATTLQLALLLTEQALKYVNLDHAGTKDCEKGYYHSTGQR